MSYEQNLGLDGYSFEPEYSENELETLDRTFPYEDEQIPLDEWCDCGNCEVMEKTEENVCCRSCDLTIPNLEELDCITDHEQFDTIVLNPAILEVSYIQIMMYKGQRGRAPDQLNNKQSRLTAYRQFVCWMLRGEKLGKGNRVTLPACVIQSIRRKFPELSGEYIGFKSVLDSITDLFP